jgi:hypothetical protein
MDVANAEHYGDIKFARLLPMCQGELALGKSRKEALLTLLLS